MSTFDPAQPALLHDMLNDKIVPYDVAWEGHWREHAQPDSIQGVIAWDGLQIDGWCEPLGG